MLARSLSASSLRLPRYLHRRKTISDTLLLNLEGPGAVHPDLLPFLVPPDHICHSLRAKLVCHLHQCVIEGAPSRLLETVPRNHNVALQVGNSLFEQIQHLARSVGAIKLYLYLQMTAIHLEEAAGGERTMKVEFLNWIEYVVR